MAAALENEPKAAVATVKMPTTWPTRGSWLSTY